jgi:hypothetical protein
MFALVAAAPSMGCDGISIASGEYTVVRVAAQSPSFSGGDNCQNDPNHTTTFENGTTFLFYGAPGSDSDVLYLDTGSNVLVGAQKDDGSYSFSGKATDVNDVGMATLTDVQTTTVDLTVDGKLMHGTVVTDDESSCSGSCMGFDPTSCTTTVKFDGVEVTGADVPPP